MNVVVRNKGIEWTEEHDQFLDRRLAGTLGEWAESIDCIHVQVLAMPKVHPDVVVCSLRVEAFSGDFVIDVCRENVFASVATAVQRVKSRISPTTSQAMVQPA